MIDILASKPVTDADRVIARGEQITLNDGTIRPVRFGFAEIARLENEFGSLAAVGDVFGAGGLGKLYDNILRMLSIVLSMPRDELASKLDTNKVQDYFSACDRAFSEALPSKKQTAVPNPNPAADGANSNGGSFTTSPPSASVDQTPSSGA